MEAQASKEKYRPLHTSAFYEMCVALGVLFAVLFLCIFPKSGIVGGMISLIFSTVNFVALIWRIRSGKLVIPKLNPRYGQKSQVECRHIEKALVWSVAGTAALAILIFALVNSHGLAEREMVAIVAVFNIYGWVTYNWWREAWQMVALCKEELQAVTTGSCLSSNPVSLTTVLPRMTPVATPEPLPLHAGKPSA